MPQGQRIIPLELPRWRNWQTRTLEGCVPQGVKVRILSEALLEGAFVEKRRLLLFSTCVARRVSLLYTPLNLLTA